MGSRRGACESVWQDRAGRANIVARSCFFEPTPQLDALVEASRLHRVVVLTGKAGAGKSSLATALARPETGGGGVPDGFVHAIAILTSDTNPARLADDLERQLFGSVPGFAEAVAEVGRNVTLPEREKLDALARKVVRPLAGACRWLHEGQKRARSRLGGDHLIRKAFHDLIESCGSDGPGSPGTPEGDRPGRRRRRGRGPFSRDD